MSGVAGLIWISFVTWLWSVPFGSRTEIAFSPYDIPSRLSIDVFADFSLVRGGEGWTEGELVLLPVMR